MKTARMRRGGRNNSGVYYDMRTATCTQTRPRRCCWSRRTDTEPLEEGCARPDAPEQGAKDASCRRVGEGRRRSVVWLVGRRPSWVMQRESQPGEPALPDRGRAQRAPESSSAPQQALGVHCFCFFLRERCDLTTDQDRPPLGDTHLVAAARLRVEALASQSTSGRVRTYARRHTHACRGAD